MWVEKHGKTYRIRERIGAVVRTVQSGYATKTAARDAKKILEADHLRGELVMPSAGRVTLGEWANQWWDARLDGLAASTQRSEGGRIRNMILPQLGSVELGDLSPLTVQLWVKDLAEDYAPKTVHNAHGVLHSIMESAVANRLIKSNPCTSTKLPKGEHREMRFLTHQEADRLLIATPEHYRPLILTALGTGLRWAELAGLRIRRLDVLGRKLRVEETLNEMAGSGELVWGPPKTAASKRTVTLPIRVAEALTPLVVDRGRDDTVFTTIRGEQLRVRNFRRVWLAALTRAGLEPEREKGVRRTEGVRFHDLRHSHVAWLLSDGRPLIAVSRRLGHTSITVTADRYGHLLPSVDEGILDALDVALPRSTWEQGGSSGSGNARSNPERDGSNRRSDLVPTP